MLVLAGAILGVKTSYDVKFRKFEAGLDRMNQQTNSEL